MKLGERIGHPLTLMGCKQLLLFLDTVDTVQRALTIDIEILVVRLPLTESHHLHIGHQQLDLVVGHLAHIANQLFDLGVVHPRHTHKGQMVQRLGSSVSISLRPFQSGLRIDAGRIETRIMARISLLIQFVHLCSVCS